MDTPILTKKQLKSTLSAKKHRPKETLKNVLAIPYDTSFWPCISSEDHEILREKLIENIPRIKNESINISWNKIKDVPKAERKAFRNELIKSISGKEPIKNKKSGICLGVNAVTRLLEQNAVSAVLITAKVQPRLMVQHIIDQAILYKVPILIFDKLKSILRTHCGVGSVAFAIEKNIPPESNVNLIRESIEKVFAKCPVPENHINYNRSLDSFKAIDLENESMKDKEIVKINEQEIHNQVYLKRPSDGSRAFIPTEIEKAPKQVIKLDIDDTGFMPFSEEPVIEVKGKLKPTYKSLIVKRLKGDKNRSKKKIQLLKQKKD